MRLICRLCGHRFTAALDEDDAYGACCPACDTYSATPAAWYEV